MTREIIDIARGAGVELIGMPDDYAINENVARITEQSKQAFFITIPKQAATSFGDYDIKEEMTVNLWGVQPCPFMKSDRDDFDAIETIASSLKETLRKVIVEINDSGLYDTIDRVTYAIVPYRNDHFTTGVLAQFTIRKAGGLCE